jgi:hypothetical protein
MLAAKPRMKQDIIDKLGAIGFPIEKAWGETDGWRLELRNGAVVRCHGDGSYVVNGPRAAELRFILRSSRFLGPQSRSAYYLF